MKDKWKIGMIYGTVVALSAAIIGTALWLRRGLPAPDVAAIVNVGKQEARDWFEIGEDLEMVNQQGETVRLSELRGKVWVVAEFFAVCPKCAVRNGSDLRSLYEQFKGHPDFQMVCISVDPEADTVEKLGAYAAALGADARNWWFLTGDRERTHRYLSQVMKFLDVRERKDPQEIAEQGKYAHDLGLMVVDRGWRVIGKRDLAWAAEEGGHLHAQYRADLCRWIEGALQAPALGSAAPGEPLPEGGRP
jgi:cytochrome oxidase Cu insertion factor (SCO1/SenC/PrrC family)